MKTFNQARLEKGVAMKIALITTTIYKPEVLSTYRKADHDIMFFVSGDRKTPHDDVRVLVKELGNAVYYSDTDQEKLGYECSEIIGWNKIMRRNISLLEAIKWGADIIITIDDDNIPLDQNYFNEFRSILSNPYNGPVANSKTGWFNIGDYLDPPVYHRGFPYEFRHRDLKVCLSPKNDLNIGVAEGLWFGDPDIDAMERLTNRTLVYQMSGIIDSGLVVSNSCFTPFNSQNTAYVSELAPLMMVWVGVGRYDDIWASYTAQRIMMETDYHIHFGKPFVWQERNPHNLWKNLKDEIFGMEFTSIFCQDLLSSNLGTGSILDKLNRLYEHLSTKTYLPPVVCELGFAWCRDVERIL